MKIGRWEVQNRGDCWVSGRPRIRKDKHGDDRVDVLDPKYHTRLDHLMASLSDREAAELWPACQDIAEFRAKLKESADAILADLNTAFSSALDMPADARQVGATPRSD